MKAPEVSTMNEARAAHAEFTLQRAAFSFFQENIELCSKPPRDVMPEIIAELPESPKLLSKQEMDLWLKENTSMSGQRLHMDVGAPSKLESYILFLLMTTSPKSTQFETTDIETTGDRFSLVDSIQILRDEVRTKRFLMGIKEAVANLLTTKDNILVCDAGCGAIPILGIQAALQSPNVQVVCIESNPESVIMARECINAFNLGNQVLVIEGDAREYKPKREIDLVISETMDIGLLNEPMCDIMSSLKPFTSNDSIFIPEQVEVLATALTASDYDSADSYALIDKDCWPVIQTKWQVIGSYKAGDLSPYFESDISVPQNNEAKIPLISSRVKIHDSVPTLDFCESRLTAFLPLPGSLQSRDSKLHISYRAGDSIKEVQIA
ncbi:MAG: hypothetical protein RLZZ360_387 [Candidatus Parcubacteria bacterium]|jgi:hypothetical protein